MSSVYDFEDFYYEWYSSLYSWDWYEDQYHSSEKYKALLGYPLMSDEEKLRGFKPIKKRKVQ